MTISNIYEMNLIKDDTEIFVRDEDMHVVAHGNWYEDQILKLYDREIESFTWQDDNKVFIDMKPLPPRQ